MGLGWGVFDDTGVGTVSVCLMFGGLLMVIGSLKDDYDKEKEKDGKDNNDIKKRERLREEVPISLFTTITMADRTRQLETLAR